MFNYIIISDTTFALDYFIPILQSNYKSLQCINCITNVESGIDKINKLKPDIIFIDSDVSSLDAFSILDYLSNSSYKTVLISETEEFAYSAFLYGVTGYLLKSHLSTQLDRVIRRIINKLYIEKNGIKTDKVNSKIRSRISISTSEGLIFIGIDKIIRIEADRSYCYLHMINGEKKTVCKSLKDVERMLPKDQYYRTHNSHLVNLKYIEMIGYQDGGYILMHDGSHIPLARRRKSDLVSYLTA